MSRNFFRVFSDASSATRTRKPFPVLTDFSVENSPLTVFPALVASPTNDKTLLLFFKLFKLLFQVFIDLLRNLCFQ